MRTYKDVEAYLTRLDRPFVAPPDTEGGGTHPHAHSATYVLPDVRDRAPLVLRVDPPLVVLRVHVGELPAEAPRQLTVCRRLLALNAQELLHASYGLEDNRIVLSAAWELESLDLSELQSGLDEVDVALAEHVPELAEMCR